jgi:spermidine synthase
MTRLASVLLFFSGMGALVLEVAWFRRIAQLVGGTSVALASVLAAVIGGMAIGAFWIGRRADRTERPARLYAGLEIGVTCCALLSPWWLTNVVAVAADAPIALRFLVSTLALSPAAILMGGTLPALASATGGRALGWLYAFNTLGGVVGTLLAGFVLLPALGLANTMRIAAVASGLAALGAFRLRTDVRPSLDEAGAWAARLYAAQPMPYLLQSPTIRSSKSRDA